MMDTHADMPACRLFDDIFSRWLEQFSHWKSMTLPPEVLHEQAFEYSNQRVAEFSRRLTREMGETFHVHIDAAVYALVALIDETVLHSDWPALSYWQACPLEYHLWQTHSAGDELPARILTLLSERQPGHRALAALYLRCLTLGFGNTASQTHHETCRLLWQFAFQCEPDTTHIAPQLEENTLEQPLRLPTRRRLPDNSRLHLIALAVVVALLLLSQQLWLSIDEAIGTTSLPEFPVTQYCEGDTP